MSAPVKIKICGITRAEDALNAVKAGADYLGLIFVSASPRSVSPENAQKIVDTVKTQFPDIKIVGVFQDHSLVDIQAILETVRLDFVQLHGTESVEFTQALPVPVIKTVILSADETSLLQRIQPYASLNNLHAFLLDLPKGAKASITEVPFAYNIQKLLNQRPYFIAGKLDSINVSEAIQQLTPFGVDVASGVESAQKEKNIKKSIEKMNAFCQAVKEMNS